MKVIILTKIMKIEKRTPCFVLRKFWRSRFLRLTTGKTAIYGGNTLGNKSETRAPLENNLGPRLFSRS